MITKVLSILSLHLIFFPVWWQFRRVIKAMADIENILNDDDFFGGTVDTTKKTLGSIENENT